MIRLSRLNGSEVHLNADLIATVESHHDTVVTLVDGRTYVVHDSAQQVVEAITRYRASVLAMAEQMIDESPAEDDQGEPEGRLLVLRPTSDTDGGADVEVATPVGIIVAIVMIAVAFIMEGGSPMVAFSNPAAIIIIVGGTVGVGMASNKMSDIGPGFKATMAMMLPGKKLDGAAAVTELMEYAETARRDGLLALEEKAKAVEDPFLKRGLELVIDGTDSDEVAEVLEADIAAMKERHKVAAKFHMDCGTYAPAIGIVGCVLGLTLALSHMEDPAEMGHAISAAFIATLWGIGIANCLLHAAGQQDEARLGRRGAAPADDRRGHPGHPGRRQPARRRREAQEPPAPKVRESVGEKKAA